MTDHPDYFPGNMKIVRDVEVRWIKGVVLAALCVKDNGDVFIDADTAAGEIVSRYERMISFAARQKMMADPVRSGED